MNHTKFFKNKKVVKKYADSAQSPINKKLTLHHKIFNAFEKMEI